MLDIPYNHGRSIWRILLKIKIPPASFRKRAVIRLEFINFLSLMNFDHLIDFCFFFWSTFWQIDCQDAIVDVCFNFVFLNIFRKD